ncbi:MAG: tRNA uridine-5-carboxymethylaminomethyl(34) synthesis enzyme MnmG [Christensenellales bacterium]|jgi:tRNA uridine 5-carboxymethylaminomethyl modification enzyme
MYDERYDAIVIGAGHAGCEAGLALARLHYKTLMLTMNLDSVALMACNPSIGGMAKGHLVREVDALGGEMGLAADDTFIQIKMLNTGKGPAVQSLRAQSDKRLYHQRMKTALEQQCGLSLKQGEVLRICVQHGKVIGVETRSGAVIGCDVLVVCSGVYQNSRVIVGESAWESGPSGLFPALGLSDSLKDLGFSLQRFKTGTPARIHRQSIDFEKMIPQYGDARIVPFSFMSGALTREQVPCYLTYTNEKTHALIRENIHRAPMYNGLISATGTRYCPSIEDKVMRFADKEKHQLFIEPEGLHTQEMYVQGLSTGLPEDIQLRVLRTVSGLEHAEIMRSAYAIEYDCLHSDDLLLSLQARHVEGLFFAGQVVGSSGYEEAAAQGIMAGINAAQYLKNAEPFILLRSEAYTGVLIDDLVTKGTPEPYRMMTSRAEYRLLLRQDNADLRLTEAGRRIGLVSDERYKKFEQKRSAIRTQTAYLQKHSASAAQVQALSKGTLHTGMRLSELLKRGIPYSRLAEHGLVEPCASDVAEQLDIQAKYAGYIDKQTREVERFSRMEHTQLPQETDYMGISGLRIEARQKLQALQPRNLGHAGRISGVSPADIAVLSVYLKSRV